MVMLDWRTSSRNSAKQNYCAGNQVGEGGNVVLVTLPSMKEASVSFMIYLFIAN